MNPTHSTHSQIRVSSSESSPSFITTNKDSQGDNTFTAVPQLSLREMLQNEPLPQQESQSDVYSPQHQSLQQIQTLANNINSTPDQTSSEHPTLPVHPTTFYYRPPNDFCHYYVDCKEISYDAVIYLLNKLLKVSNAQSDGNECIIYYQQQYDNRVYQISCEIASPRLINNCLNKNFLGVELQQQNVEQENLSFTLDQKENLEFHLLQYLSNYLLK